MNTQWITQQTNAANEPFSYEIVSTTIIPASPAMEGYLKQLREDENKKQHEIKMSDSLWDAVSLAIISLAFAILSIALYSSK